MVFVVVSLKVCVLDHPEFCDKKLSTAQLLGQVWPILAIYPIPGHP